MKQKRVSWLFFWENIHCVTQIPIRGCSSNKCQPLFFCCSIPRLRQPLQTWTIIIIMAQFYGLINYHDPVVMVKGLLFSTKACLSSGFSGFEVTWQTRKKCSETMSCDTCVRRRNGKCCRSSKEDCLLCLAGWCAFICLMDIWGSVAHAGTWCNALMSHQPHAVGGITKMKPDLGRFWQSLASHPAY